MSLTRFFARLTSKTKKCENEEEKQKEEEGEEFKELSSFSNPVVCRRQGHGSSTQMCQEPTMCQTTANQPLSFVTLSFVTRAKQEPYNLFVNLSLRKISSLSHPPPPLGGRNGGWQEPLNDCAPLPEGLFNSPSPAYQRHVPHAPAIPTHLLLSPCHKDKN